MINYDSDGRVICVDFKIVNFLFGQERGYTKYPLLSLQLESPGLLNQRKSQCKRAKHHQKDVIELRQDYFLTISYQACTHEAIC